MKRPLPKLSDLCLPLLKHTLSFCQLCGKEYKDKAAVRLWEEYDDSNKKTGPNSKVIVVGVKCCQRKIDDHPRGYLQVPWGRGKPGMFPLVCGDCKHRKDLTCINPQAEINGGPGIDAILYDPLGGINVHVHNQGWADFRVVGECKGHQAQDGK